RHLPKHNARQPRTNANHANPDNLIRGGSRPFAAENSGPADSRSLRLFLAPGGSDSSFLRAFHFAQTGGLAFQFAQVEQLGAAHLVGACDLHFVDDLGVEREDALDALPKADLAHGKASARAVAARDNGAFKRLHAFFVAFLDLYLDADGVARLDGREVVALQPGSEFFHDGML